MRHNISQTSCKYRVVDLSLLPLYTFISVTLGSYTCRMSGKWGHRVARWLHEKNTASALQNTLMEGLKALVSTKFTWRACKYLTFVFVWLCFLLDVNQSVVKSKRIRLRLKDSGAILFLNVGLPACERFFRQRNIPGLKVNACVDADSL